MKKEGEEGFVCRSRRRRRRARTVFIDAGKAVKNEGLSQHLERANEVTLISRLI